MIPYSSTPLRTNADGTIDERDAAHIEESVSAILRNQLGGAVTRVSFVVNRTDNVQSSRTLRYKVRLGALSYAKEIDGEWAFASVALAA
jgi:hypothetical protein